MKKQLLYLSLALVMWQAHAQGTFRNLDFEAATVQDLPSGANDFVSIQSGLPGWAGYIGSTELTTVFHNGVTIGAAAMSVLGPGFVNTLFGADITRFAGQQQRLAFTAALGPTGANGFLLDDIAFSTQVVPEPSAISLLLGGSLTLLTVHLVRRPHK
jgi:hypothetical protein